MTRQEFDIMLSELRNEIGEYTSGWTIAEDSEYVYENSIKTEIIDDGILDQSRWSISKYIIVKVEDEFYFEVAWDAPATEMQEGQPTNCEVYEVIPVEKKIITYQPVK